MRMPSYRVRVRWQALLATVVSCAGLAAACAQMATAATKKQYTVSLTPNPAPNGATGVDVTATFADLSTSNQSIGSVQLIAPSGFTVTGASVNGSSSNATVSGNTVTFNNLSIAPGSSGDVHVTVNTPSKCGTYNWTVSAHQANEFNSGGNILNPSPSTVAMTVGTACSLAFTSQPHSVVDATPGLPSDAITDTNFTPPPTGGPVKVQVYDASGNPVGAGTTVTVSLNDNPGLADLGGTLSHTTDSTGTATFSDLTVDEPGDGYTLKASISGASVISNKFSAQNAASSCAQGVQCQVDAGNSFSDSLVTTDPSTSGGTDSGFLFESVNPNGNKFPLVCPNYTTLDPNTFEVGMDSGVNNRTKIWTETIFDVASTQSQAASVKAGVQVCFGDTLKFINNKNKTAARGTLPDGSTGYVDLLPNCPQPGFPCHDRSADSSQPDPNGLGFDLIVVAQIPPGFDYAIHN
jgi:hypothetical protein